MKMLLLVLIMIQSLIAKDATVDCNKVFDLRKGEIARDIERLEEQKQSLEALKEANEEVLFKKKSALLKQADELNATRVRVEKTKKEALEIFEKNKQMLADIKKAKDDKLSKAYLKMKDAKAAAILDKMKQHEAALILFNLTPKKISKIMAKMDALNASGITNLLSKGPPFEGKSEE